MTTGMLRWNNGKELGHVAEGEQFPCNPPPLLLPPLAKRKHDGGTTIQSLARSLPLLLNLPEPIALSLVLCNKASLLSPGLIATPHTLWVCHTPHEPLQPYDHSTAECSPFAFLQLHKFLHCSRSQDDRSNQASRLECHFTIAWRGLVAKRLQALLSGLLVAVPVAICYAPSLTSLTLKRET